MESAGARLKKLRLEKGISLEEVYKKTKIHLNILKAIEEDGIINLSPVYIRGFLKIYCKFLGVDFRDYIPDYKEPQQTIVKYVSDKEGKARSFIKTVSIKLISLKPHIKIRTIFIFISILIFSIGLFYIGKIISYKQRASSKKAKLTAVIPAKLEKKGRITKTQKAKNPSGIMPESRSPTENPQKETVFGVRLSIRAKEDCYMQLKADGKVVFQNILRKSRSESWQAKDKIELFLGNAGVVELEVDGKIISNLGRRGQALKNIVVTKEGLSVGR